MGDKVIKTSIIIMKGNCCLEKWLEIRLDIFCNGKSKKMNRLHMSLNTNGISAFFKPVFKPKILIISTRSHL